MADENVGFDLIIPFHGQYTLVRELIGSICLYTRNIPYRITIVDDGSDNKAFFSTLAQLPNIDGVRLDEQKGFGAAVNMGIKLTKRPWIVLMNSDCKVEEVGWLMEMYKTLCALKKENVGLVSARSDDPPGDHPLLKTPRQPREDIGNVITDKPVSLFCSLLSRKMVEHIGSLKEYPYGWYEDEEYFWRMKKNGYKQAVSGRAWVRHLGGATVKELWHHKPEAKTIMEDNRKLCLADLKKMFGKS
jgi:GT2 family glycosyltransferase